MRRIERQLRRERYFVGGRHAGELLHFTGACAPVQAFDVALLADFERALAPGLDEVALGLHRAQAGAVGTQRRDEGRQYNNAGASEQARSLAGTAQVFAAVFGREAKVGTQALAQAVAVE